MGTLRITQRYRSQRRREVSKVLPSPRWKVGKIQVRDREILQVYQGTKVPHTPGIENSRHDPRIIDVDRPLESHLLDER